MLASGKKKNLMITVMIRMATPKLPRMAIDQVHRQEQRLGDEVEIAPVDQQLEAVELELLVVAVDDVDLLGAGEEVLVDASGSPRRDGQGGAEIVGLVGLDVVAGRARRELRIDAGLGVGKQRRGPILVGDAEPAALVAAKEMAFCFSILA